MVLRIGVKDGKEATARAAVAAAARGCAGWFQQLRGEWNLSTGKPLGVSTDARRKVRVAPQAPAK